MVCQSAHQNPYQSIIFDGTKFVAIASDKDGGGEQVIHSTDGINWTEYATPGDQWVSLAYGNGKYVAVTYNPGGSGHHIMHSDDAITWTSVAAPSAKQWRSVVFGNNIFVCHS